MANYYAYEELRAKATSPEATQDDINALGEWFDAHGSIYWNGEYYDADGLRLFPINEEVAEDEREVVGYEFR